ncbi:MAG: hypothetical protein IPM97_02585 [Bdellovibrionaceae bacterium]|nr:hypothetical protein [Pseudobdellovibrionaceae bacterium]
MSLLNISQLRDPSERAPLGDRADYEEGLQIIEQGDFSGYDLRPSESGAMHLQISWSGGPLSKLTTVRINEQNPHGPLVFSCSDCLVAGRSARSCSHQWASFVLLWKAVTASSDELRKLGLVQLSAQLKGPNHLGALEEASNRHSEFDLVTLESLTLCIDEPPLLGGPSLGKLLNQDFSKYRLREVSKDKELLSPRLWNLPEIFRKKVSGYSEHYFNEINKQNRIADLIRYNFSNGMQLSAKEILRHPLHKKVAGELLPQETSQVSAFAKWSLLQNNERTFVSQAMSDLEAIIQSLLNTISSFHRRKKVEVFLQNKHSPGRALKIESLEFDLTSEVDWRVEFVEKKELEAEFKLVCFRKRPLFFYESFAVEPVDGIVIVHPWWTEFDLLKEALGEISNDLEFEQREMPTIDVVGELEAKTILRHLRGRAIPVKISGETRTLSADQSRTEIHLSDDGGFFLQHEARVHGQKNLVRRGWTTKGGLFLQALSQGLPFLLGAEPKEIASRNRSKREWDLKLLKHLGVLQYIFLEALSLHFDQVTTDGSEVKKENLFLSLHEKVQRLLVVGTGSTFVRDVPLTELCSKSVLACFDDFVSLTFKAFKTDESFYSENGEVIMEGVVERELRLIYEILKKATLVSGGEIFKKSRTPLVVKKEGGDNCYFPTGDRQSAPSLQSSLESVQSLIPFGFKIHYKGQPIEELDENEFQVDFVLQADGEQKNFNWFELNPKFFLRGEEVDPDHFLSLGSGGVIEFGGRLFLVPQKQLPSLRRLEKFWQRLQKSQKSTSKKKNSEKNLSVATSSDIGSFGSEGFRHCNSWR